MLTTFRWYSQETDTSSIKMLKTQAILACDIGNTRCKVALFQGSDILQQWRFPNDGLFPDDFFNDALLFDAAIISNTGEINDSWFELTHNRPFLWLSAETPLPFKISYDTPATLGADRIATVAAAHALYPRTNCLVIDAGTCITYDWLTHKGEWLGGNISPGLNMRYKAMDVFTAKLPGVEYGETKSPIGKSTNEALINGGFLGCINEIEGIIQKAERDFKKH